MARRRNPGMTLWLVLGVVGVGGYLWWRSRTPGGAPGGYRVDPSGRGVRWTGDPTKGPPPALTPAQRAAMERGYRYRFAGGGRCFDYKERKFVDASYCR